MQSVRLRTQKVAGTVRPPAGTPFPACRRDRARLTGSAILIALILVLELRAPNRADLGRVVQAHMVSNQLPAVSLFRRNRMRMCSNTARSVGPCSFDVRIAVIGWSGWTGGISLC